MTYSFALLPVRKSILVLDDEDSMRRLARRLLESGGYDVLEAESGEKAVQVAERTPGLALVICDVVLPGMTAAAAWQAISLCCREARVLFTSGYTDEQLVSHALLTPRTPLLRKPYTPGTLLSAVQRALGGIDSAPLVAEAP